MNTLLGHGLPPFGNVLSLNILSVDTISMKLIELHCELTYIDDLPNFRAIIWLNQRLGETENSLLFRMQLSKHAFIVIVHFINWWHPIVFCHWIFTKYNNNYWFDCVSSSDAGRQYSFEHRLTRENFALTQWINKWNEGNKQKFAWNSLLNWADTCWLFKNTANKNHKILEEYILANTVIVENNTRTH